MLFAGSGLPVYMKSSKKIFGKNTNHIRHIHLAGKKTAITTTRWNDSTGKYVIVKKSLEV